MMSNILIKVGIGQLLLSLVLLTIASIHPATVTQPIIELKTAEVAHLILDLDSITLEQIQQQIQTHHIQQPKNPVQCLTDNIYFEAATEPEEGKIAVAQVTMNRVADGIGGDTVCDVVYFKKINPNTGKKEAAFSWTLGSKWRPHGINIGIYRECEVLARAVLTGHLHSDIIDSTVAYYHANYIHPVWANEHELVATIGQHIFYK